MADTAIQRHVARRRSGHTISVTIGDERFRLTANGRNDGTLGEVLIQWGKQGTTAAGLMDIYADALSLGLRHGVPLTDLVAHGVDLCFVPNGRTDDPEIPRVRSVADWVARRLAIDWLPDEERARLGIHTVGSSDRPADHEVSDTCSNVADLFATDSGEERVPVDEGGPAVRVDDAELAAFRAELADGIGAPTPLSD